MIARRVREESKCNGSIDAVAAHWRSKRCSSPRTLRSTDLRPVFMSNMRISQRLQHTFTRVPCVMQLSYLGRRVLRLAADDRCQGLTRSCGCGVLRKPQTAQRHLSRERPLKKPPLDPDIAD